MIALLDNLQFVIQIIPNTDLSFEVGRDTKGWERGNEVVLDVATSE